MNKFLDGWIIDLQNRHNIWAFQLPISWKHNNFLSLMSYLMHMMFKLKMKIFLLLKAKQ